MNLHKKFLIAAIVALSLSALLGIVALLGLSGSLMDRTIATSLSFAYFCLASFVAVMAIERRRLVPVAWLAIGWVALAFGLTTCEIWGDRWLRIWFPGKGEEEWVVTGFTIAGLCALLLLLWSPERVCRRAAQVRWVACVGAVVSTWFAIDSIFEITEHEYDAYYWRVGGAIAILTGCASVIFPILLRFDRIHQLENAATTALEMKIECPRCGLSQRLPAGRRRCAKCRLRFNIEIEEPRCPKCRYVLYEGIGEKCPECGEPIPEEDRWVMVTKRKEEESSNGMNDNHAGHS